MSTLPKVLCILFLFAVGISSNAQLQVSNYTDYGSIQTSDDVFLKSAIQGQYQYKKYTLSSGIQSSIIGYNPKVISGIQVNTARQFHLKSLPIKFEAMYIWNNFGELIRENNWGVFLHFKGKRYNIKQGIHFRNLYYSQQAISDYSLQYDTEINENWNILYAFEFFLKPQDHKWNVGICGTNMDQFVINQETNPFFYLSGKYRYKNAYNFFLESWYKSAGALNASVHYFGFFFRTGIQWQIDTKQ